MRSLFVIAAGVLISIACGSQSNASSNPAAAFSRTDCVDVKAPHHAYVVVQHMSGAVIDRCIGFGATFIDGQTIMDRSGIQYQAQSKPSGKAVCQVDLEPRQYSECVSQNNMHWVLFIQSQGRWSKAQAGYTDIRLSDGDALGWRYVKADDHSPAPPPPPRRL